ncbi:hypothetical protein GLYMA_06G170432v4 [Glycine max]|nr:hypothetical protein GLYMA_06G170432v4 [Glycine max]KAH1126345.1 hypothetical protein GYH30_015373 [Glycine max]
MPHLSESMCESRKPSLLWHCEWNNSCGCWWWGKSLVRLHNTPYLESLQGSRLWAWQIDCIQSSISCLSTREVVMEGSMIPLPFQETTEMCWPDLGTTYIESYQR